MAEGALVAGLAIWAYVRVGAPLWLVLAVILAPDLAMLGYLLGPRAGAAGCDAAHSYLAPATLAAIGALAGWDWTVPTALVWTVHVGGDRAIGYGLKDARGFKRTHLSAG